MSSDLIAEDDFTDIPEMSFERVEATFKPADMVGHELPHGLVRFTGITRLKMHTQCCI